MSKKESKPCFVVTYPLRTNKMHEDMLARINTQSVALYNAIQEKMLKYYQFATSHNDFKNETDPKKRSQFLGNFSVPWRSKMKEGSNRVFTSFGVTNLVTRIGRGYPLLNSGNAQLIGDMCWSAWDKKIKAVYKNEDPIEIRIKDKDALMSLKYKKQSNGKLNGIMFGEGLDSVIVKIGPKKTMTIPFQFRKSEYDCYVREIISKNEVALVAIVPRQVRGEVKYDLQITLYGVPYNKMRRLGKGKVGVDVGEYTIASYGSEVDLSVLSFNEKEQYIEKLTRLERLMDRSRRATNPDNYDEKGRTIKPEDGGELTWVFSKHYMEYRAKHREIVRKAHQKRKEYHNFLANRLLSLGDEFNIENNDIKSWAKRKTETVINPKTGLPYSKKRGGKAIQSNAPAALVTIIENKVRALGGTVNKIPCCAGATQFDFTSCEFVKHSPEERQVVLSNGNVHTRDGIAAFNLKHCNNAEDIKTKSVENYDLDGMKKDYENFVAKENAEKELHKKGLKQSHSTMGI